MNRCSIISYGIVNVPSQPGYQQLACPTWRPVGSIVDKLANLFSGETIHLSDDSLVHSHQHRHQLHTQSMGTVHFQLNIVLCNFDKYGIETH